ncbi:MAG TPA: tetratricopeptide repeat protein, partial [Pyrinomonadaceae bacterium]|nr:tetratricopeptide repeat protein [Pyrinomonadaceae bacterium]
LAIKPSLVNAIEQLGLAYFRQKRFADSAVGFEQLKNYKPDARTYNYLGESYFESGKITESIEAFNQAVNFNPNFDRARFNLGRAYLKNGDRDSAELQYQLLQTAKSEWADRLYVLLNP